MAGSRTLHEQTFTRSPTRDDWSVSGRAAVAAGGLLLLALLAVMTLAPQPIESPQAEERELALAGQSGRVVNVYSAIMKFGQHGDAIGLNLMPSNYGRRVFV